MIRSAIVMSGIDSNLDSRGDIPQSVAQRLAAVDTLPAHIEQPNVSYDIYSLARRFALAEIAGSRHRLYLDTKWWIYLRDASLGQPQKPEHVAILELLSDLAERRDVCCPISYDSFSEWRRQRHDSRMATARVIDRLSSGLVLQPEKVRTQIEISHFVWNHLLGVKTKERFAYMWLPMGYPVGELIPSETSFSPQLEKAIQKSLFDVMSHMRMVDLAAMLENEPADRESDESFWNYQTLMARVHRSRFTSYKQLFEVEVSGTCDMWIELVEPFARALLDQGRTSEVPIPPRNAHDYAQYVVALIAAGLKLERLSTELPCLHIHPSIHALMRYRRMPYRKGDLHDMHHAVAALPYFDAFLTERRLGNLLHDAPPRLADTYGCAVIRDETEALRYLESFR